MNGKELTERLQMERELFFDAFARERKSGELSARQGIPSTIRGIRAVACPWTRRYLRQASPDPDRRSA